MLQIINEVAKVATEKAMKRSAHEDKDLSTLLTEELIKAAQKKSHNANLAVKQCDQNKNSLKLL